MNPFAYLFNLLRLGENSTINEFLRFTRNSFIGKNKLTDLEDYRQHIQVYVTGRSLQPLGTNRESVTFLHEQTDSIALDI